MYRHLASSDDIRSVPYNLQTPPPPAPPAQQLQLAPFVAQCVVQRVQRVSQCAQALGAEAWLWRSFSQFSQHSSMGSSRLWVHLKASSLRISSLNSVQNLIQCSNMFKISSERCFIQQRKDIQSDGCADNLVTLSSWRLNHFRLCSHVRKGKGQAGHAGNASTMFQ